MNVVYRLYSITNELLYVGRTRSDLHQRLAERRAESWWPEVSHCALVFPADREEARRVEWQAIKEEAPRYNKMGVVSVGAQTFKGRKMPRTAGLF